MIKIKNIKIQISTIIIIPIRDFENMYKNITDPWCQKQNFEKK